MAALIIEKGDIYFFFRPKIGKKDAHTLDDVQRFFFILKSKDRSPIRKIIVGKKKMPVRDVEFAFVDKASEQLQDMIEELQGERYTTKTRGEREEPEAHLIAEGKYLLLFHERAAHLIYRLVHPSKPDDQLYCIFDLSSEGNYILSVKNPRVPSQKGLESYQKADLPEDLQNKFSDRRFIPLDTAAFLDYEGVELLIIGEKAKPEEAWGFDILHQFATFPHDSIRGHLG